MLENTGVPTREDIEKVLPSEERLKKGPVAVIECFQKIPCDPCYHSCLRGAINPLIDINDLPIVDHERCNGCSLCITNCPGLAIFIIDATYSEDEALIKMPYEMRPLPEEGEIVTSLNREGEAVGEGRIVKVELRKRHDKTAIVSMAVPKKDLHEVRNFQLRGATGER